MLRLRDFLEELLKQNKHLIEIEDANRKMFTKTLFSMSVFEQLLSQH